MDVKTSVKNCWQKVKTWVGNHKKEMMLGSAAAIIGTIGVVIYGAIKKENDAHEDEGQDILKALEMARQLDDDGSDENENIDRFTIDKSLMDRLPPGTYDVFDGYLNERVDYVVEGKESMET